MPYLGTRQRPALGPVQQQYTRLNYAAVLADDLFVAVPDLSGALPPDGKIYNVAAPGFSLPSDYTVDSSFWKRFESSYNGKSVTGGWSQDIGTRYILPDVSSFINVRNQVTFSAIVQINLSDPDGIRCPWDLRNGSGSAQHYPYTDNNMYIGTFATTRYITAQPYNLAVNSVTHMVTISFANGAQKLYQNGILRATGTLAENPGINYTDNSGYPGFGGNAATSSYTLTNQIFAVWMWNRILNDAEVMYHCENPWDVFEVSKRRRYFFPTAGPVGGVGNARSFWHTFVS